MRKWPIAPTVVGLGMWLASFVAAAAHPKEIQHAADVPLIVPDESAADWVVDRFAGNSTAGGAFYQGPAAEAGGIGRPAVAVAPDGTVYLATGGMSWLKDTIVRVSPDGMMRLLAGGGSSLADGSAAKARIAVDYRGGGLAWSKRDSSLYFVHPTVPAVRRLYQKDEQWLVATAAGDPHKAGRADGPAHDALFAEPRSLAVTSAGTIYLLDGNSLLRKIDEGRVSTVAKFVGGPEIVDGPLEKATFSITNMSGQIALGETDDVLYVADHWHFCVRRIDLKAGQVTTVAGMRRPPEGDPRAKRYNANSDGPALNLASFNSGCAYLCYDPVHKALWLGGPDESRMRWLRDGWVKTVTGAKPGPWTADAAGTPADKPQFTWGNVAAVDPQGRVYITTPGGGVWRAYRKNARQGDSAGRLPSRITTPARLRAGEEVREPEEWPVIRPTPASLLTGEGVRRPALATPVSLVAATMAAPTGEGIRVGEEVAVCSDGRGGDVRGTPHVAFGDGCYLAVWREGFSSEGGAARIFAARLSKDGKPLDARPIEIAPCKDGFQELPRVSFGGGRYLVVWQDFRNGKDCDVLAARVSPEGKVHDARPIAIAVGPRTQAVPDVASDGREFLVAWQGFLGEEAFCRAFTARVTADGRATAAGEIKSPWAAGAACPRLAWDGTNYRVAFLAQSLLSVGLGPDGKPLDNDRVAVLREHLGAGIGFSHSVAAAPGRGMLVVYPRSQPDYWGWGGPGAMIACLIGADGRIDPGMPKDQYPQAKLANWLDFGKDKSDGSPWPYGQSAVAWDGRQFVAVWQRHHIRKTVSLANCDLVASRLDGWKPQDGAGASVAATDLEERAPALASDGAGKLLCVYEKHGEDGKVSIVARLLQSP